MSMKKKALMGASYVLVAAMAIGGTVAYLTDRDNATNTFTMGDVEIELNEKFDQGAQLMPGVNIEKVPTITNTGKSDAYVWLTFSIPAALDNWNPNSDEGSNKNTIHWNPMGATTAGKADFAAKGADYTYVDDARVNKAIVDEYLPSGITAAEITTNNMTWNVFNNFVDGGNAYQEDINGVKYNTYVIPYNKALAPDETTLPTITKVFLDANIDYNINDGKYYRVEKGVTTLVDYDLSDVKIYVNAYGIQADGFDNVKTAYDAYVNQWDDGADKIPLNGIYEDVSVTAVESAADLNTALADGNNAILTDDVTTDANIVLAGGTLNGDGNTVDGTSNKTTGRTDCVITTTGGTVQNVVISGGFRGVGSGSSGSYSLKDDLYLSNVTVTGTTYGINISGGNGHKLVVESSTICDWNSYAGLSEANFTDCKFTSEDNYYCTQRISAGATFTYTNCKFEQNTYEDAKYYLESYDGTGTIVFENCYMGETLITSENVWELFDASEEMAVKVVVNNG